MNDSSGRSYAYGCLGRVALAFVFLGLAAVLPGQTRPSTPHTAAAADHAVLDRILSDVVHTDRVDYRRVKQHHVGALSAYLERLAAVDAAPLERREQLAYYINLYNATMIRAVLNRMRPGWTPAADGFAVFDAKLVRLKGRTVSLNALEHEIIRPTFHDPRIHVALVCAARSCPPLLPRAYRAADLEQVLDDNMRRFVNDASRNRIDVKGRRLELSQLFEWYADDFGGAAGVVAYVNRWTEQDVTGFSVVFREYDWDLNEPGSSASAR